MSLELHRPPMFGTASDNVQPGFVSFSQIPEPSAFVFLGLVGVAVAGWQWKKRCNSSTSGVVG